MFRFLLASLLHQWQLYKIAIVRNLSPIYRLFCVHADRTSGLTVNHAETAACVSVAPGAAVARVSWFDIGSINQSSHSSVANAALTV